MSERRVIEIFYPDFSSSLRNATNSKKKIERSDKEAWAAYVKKHNVPEPAMISRGKAGTLSGKIELVIIDGTGKSDGYYVYCSGEDFCLKFESGIE